LAQTLQFDPIEFEKNWQENLKEPDTLYLSYLPINLTELILNSTSKNKGIEENIDLVDIIQYLTNYLKDGDFVLNKIITKVDSSAIKDLISLVDQNNFDKKKIIPLIQRIDNVLREDNFVKSIKDMFLNDEIKTDEYFLVVGNLLRTLLIRYSISELNGFPSIIISDLLGTRKFKELAMDFSNTDSINPCAKDVLEMIEKRIETELDKIMENDKQEDYIQENFLPTFNWVKSCESVYENINSHLNNLGNYSNIEEHLIRDLTIGTVRRVYQVILHGLLEKTNSFTPNEFLAANYFKDIVTKIGNVTQISRSEIDFSMLEASKHAFIEFAWESRITQLDGLIKTEAEIFSNFLLNEMGLKKSKLIQFQFYMNLVNFLKEMMSRVFDTAYKNFKLDINNATVSIFLSFLRDELQIRLSNRRNYKTIVKNMAIIDQHTIITKLFDRFLDKEKSIEVFFTLGNLDMKYKKKELKSNILVYDPREYHFGESYRLDWISTDEKDIENNLFSSYYRKYHFIKSHSNRACGENLKRNSCRVRITVNAYDYEKAIEKGLREVLNTVSLMTFMSSKINLNYKPQILNACYARLSPGSNGYFRREIITNNRIDSFSYEPKNWQILDNLITYMSKSNLGSEIEEAISLIRLGYLNPNIHLKFSTYWTALEQLIKPFVQNDKDINVMTHLSITWRNTKPITYFNLYYNEITRKIKNNAELLIKLNNDIPDWNKYDFSLVENLYKIKQMTTDESLLKSINNFIKWLYGIDKETIPPISIKESIVNETVLRKVIQKFKVFILDSKRNQIFHEGYRPIDGLNYMTNFLEELLFEIIINILKMESLQKTNKLNCIIIQLNRPFKDPNFYAPISFSNIKFEEADQK